MSLGTQNNISVHNQSVIHMLTKQPCLLNQDVEEIKNKGVTVM
jgi:hypothetical protein